MATASSLAQPEKTPFWGAKAPQLAPEGPIEVVVSLDEQRAYACRNGILIGESTSRRRRWA